MLFSEVWDLYIFSFIKSVEVIMISNLRQTIRKSN
jgi:hypothetical protein